jgi:hypothetical protein
MIPSLSSGRALEFQDEGGWPGASLEAARLLAAMPLVTGPRSTRFPREWAGATFEFGNRPCRRWFTRRPERRPGRRICARNSLGDSGWRVARPERVAFSDQQIQGHRDAQVSCWRNHRCQCDRNGRGSRCSVGTATCPTVGRAGTGAEGRLALEGPRLPPGTRMATSAPRG